MISSVATAKVVRNSRQIVQLTRNLCRSCVTSHKGMYSHVYRKIQSSTLPLKMDCFYSSNCMKSHDSIDHSITWPDMRAQAGTTISPKFVILQLDEVVELIREEGGTDVVVIGVPEEMCYVEYFIVATANSPRHLTSITEMVNKLYKKKRGDNQPFALIEGKRHSDNWQCIDIGNIVIHVMLGETRALYNLEELWLLGPKYDEELHKTPTTEDLVNQISKGGLNLMSMTDDTVKALGNINFDNPWPKDSHVDPLETEQEGDTDHKTRLEDDDAFLV